MFEALIFVVSIAAGAVAAIAGFGIGSLITPVFALQFPIKVAVAAVAIPHLVATATRLWIMRAHVDRRLLRTFGITSAAGGLAGALLAGVAGNPALTIIFGGALILTALLDLTGASKRLRFHGAVAWVAGAVSGFLGGMVGNQGGIRSAALLGFETTPQTFVATATAVALLVDIARVPIYAAGQLDALSAMTALIGISVAGALAGTFVGRALLERIPETTFRPVVASLILALGTYMLFKGLGVFSEA